MKIKIRRVTSWIRVVNAARFTVNKYPIDHEPLDEFKEKLIRSEHSPLRLLEYDIQMYKVPYWVVMHLVRHHVGVQPFVSTQRPDRTGGASRHDLPQDALVNVQLSINAQAILNISRLRLCENAAYETKKLWRAVILELKNIDPILAKYCVPQCTFKGFCSEFNSCGKSKLVIEANHLNLINNDSNRNN